MEAHLSTFSSPGPEILELGIFSLRWYGLLIAIAVLIGINISNYLAKQRGLPSSLINDLFPFLVCAAIIGARIYYVAFEWSQYKNNFFKSLAIWEGGIAIHGALIAGILTVLIFCRFKKEPFWEVLDVLLPSVALGQAIGRWGNFFNNEAFGLPTNLPWKLFIPTVFRPEEFLTAQYFHPTFLYESLWDLALFTALITFFLRNKYDLVKLPRGAISCFYFIAYGFGRFLIEGLRTDPLCFNSIPPFCEGGFRVAQLMSLLLIGTGILGIWWLYIRKKDLPDLSLYRNLRT